MSLYRKNTFGSPWLARLQSNGVQWSGHHIKYHKIMQNIVECDVTVCSEGQRTNIYNYAASSSCHEASEFAPSLLHHLPVSRRSQVLRLVLQHQLPPWHCKARWSSIVWLSLAIGYEYMDHVRSKSVGQNMPKHCIASNMWFKKWWNPHFRPCPRAIHFLDVLLQEICDGSGLTLLWLGGHKYQAPANERTLSLSHTHTH